MTMLRKPEELPLVPLDKALKFLVSIHLKKSNITLRLQVNNDEMSRRSLNTCIPTVCRLRLEPNFGSIKELLDLEKAHSLGKRH